MPRYSSLRERLDANSRPMDLVPGLGPCRIWRGALNTSGYPLISKRVRATALYKDAKGRRRKQRKVKNFLAHRVSLADALGVTIWSLRKVCHACDNKPCIEPAHLRSRTQSMNMAECLARGRHNSQQKGVSHDAFVG